MILRLILCTFILFSSCSEPKRQATSDEQQEIRISLPTEPPTLDWNLATDNVSYQILNQLMEGLTQYDQNLNPIPAVADSWEVLDQGRLYVFHLNKNYRWSDGQPVIASHFRDSWLRLLSPQTASEYAYFLFDIEGAQKFNSGQIDDPHQVGIEVINDLTLRVRLKKPVVYFPMITTFMVTYPIRLDLIQKQGDRWTAPENMVTCGPYLLKEWWHEYRLKLAINPHYGGSPQPELKKITLFLVNDPSTVLSLYDLDQLDVAPLPPLAMEQYKNHPDLIRLEKLRGYYYGFNIHKKPFDDVRMRRAFAHALDKSILPEILKGGEKVVDSWIPPGMFGYEEKIGLHFDAEKAKKLFVGSAPTQTIPLVFNSDPTNKKIAEWAQAQWKKNLGIDITLQNREWKSYLSLMKEDPPPLFRLGWGADFPDPDNFMNLFTSFSGNNHTGWKNKSYDDLISIAAMEQNPEKRKSLYDQAQEMILEDEAIIIPLFIPTQNILVKPAFRPYPLLPLDFVYYKNVKLKK